MLSKLSKEDFGVLRGPFESGRQSPNSLASTLFLAIFLQSLLFYLTYYVAAESTIYPNVERIQTVHFWITAGLLLLSIIFAIPAIYRRSEKLQYLVTILVSQNFTVFFYFCALFIIGEGPNSTEQSLLNFTYITLLIGVLFFIFLCIRFYRLLMKGYYQKGSKKDQLRGRFETKSYLPMAIGGSIGLVFILQYIWRTFQSADLDMIFFIVLPLIIFYTMIFVLPEQLVTLYCKYRFESFNFDTNGYLKTGA